MIKYFFIIVPHDVESVNRRDILRNSGCIFSHIRSNSQVGFCLTQQRFDKGFDRFTIGLGLPKSLILRALTDDHSRK